MRSLVASADVVSAGAYRHFMQSAQAQALFPDGLVAGEPYLALNAIVMTGQDLALMRDLTRTFSLALHKAAERLARDVPALIELGFPWVAAELLAAETPRTPIIGRFDFAQDSSGRWWMLEFNADTPSGVREGIVVDGLVWRELGRQADLIRPNRRLGYALIQAFRKALTDLPRGGILGLVTTASELEDLAQMAFTRDLLGGPLGSLGFRVVLGDVDNLRAVHGGLELLGQRVDALYRYLPFEGMLGSPIFAAIGEAATRGLPRILNGLFGLLLQNKGLLAWLWGHQDDPFFTKKERAAIEAHLPATWMIGETPVDNGPTVIKQVFGREGEEVFFSEDLTTDQLARLQRLRSYVVQRQVDVAPIVAALPTALGQEIHETRASVGCFAVDGRWAGFYSRLGGKVITSRAKYVATFVEDAVESHA